MSLQFQNLTTLSAYKVFHQKEFAQHFQCERLPPDQHLALGPFAVGLWTFLCVGCESLGQRLGRIVQMSF